MAELLNFNVNERGIYKTDNSEKLNQRIINEAQTATSSLPFASKKTQTGITAGILMNQTKLIVESLMPANGVIFSDGIETDFLKFNLGSIATIGIAKEKAQLVTH